MHSASLSIKDLCYINLPHFFLFSDDMMVGLRKIVISDQPSLSTNFDSKSNDSQSVFDIFKMSKHILGHWV